MTTSPSPPESTVGRTERRDGVIVVGGGYAGLHAVRAAERAGADVTLIDRSGTHDFVTRLAAVAGGAAPVEDAGQPLDRFAGEIEIGSLAAVDDGVVELDDGRRIEADAVVVTAGAEPSRPPIDGLEHAATLRTGDDALALRAAIADSTSVVIVGGGATGVQLAGAIADAHPSVEVHLVETADRLLPGLPSGLGDGAARILAGRGVVLRLGASADRITSGGLDLGDEHIEGLVVWAGGFTADAERLGAPTDDAGRIVVDPDLRVAGTERTFAAGDIAAHVDWSGDALPMSAQIAVRAGTIAGRNAARVARGESTTAASLMQLGWVFDLSGRRGLAQLGPFELSHPFTDLIPPLLHDAIDVKNLLEIGGIGALRFAPESVRALLRLVPPLRAGSAPQPAPAMI